MEYIRSRTFGRTKQPRPSSTTSNSTPHEADATETRYMRTEPKRGCGRGAFGPYRTNKRNSVDGGAPDSWMGKTIRRWEMTGPPNSRMTR